jgi:hypothetical protein
MTNQDENLPKVPPFVPPAPTQPRNNHNNVAEEGMLRVVTLLISLVSLAIALASGAVLAITVLTTNSSDKYDGIWPKLVVLGLAYMVGWIVGLYSIRGLHNLVLPILIQVYIWLCLAGVCALYIAIIVKLFNQGWSNLSFAKYCLVMIAGLLAMIGLHLMLENHSLVIFAIPLLLICLIHLYLIVFHYVFFPAWAVDYGKLWGDIAFFLGMVVVSILMLAHLGLLEPTRRRIGRMFSNGQPV